MSMMRFLAFIRLPCLTRKLIYRQFLPVLGNVVQNLLIEVAEIEIPFMIIDPGVPLSQDSGKGSKIIIDLGVATNPTALP